MDSIGIEQVWPGLAIAIGIVAAPVLVWISRRALQARRAVKEGPVKGAARYRTAALMLSAATSLVIVAAVVVGIGLLVACRWPPLR